jgi:hypothetical protein
LEYFFFNFTPLSTVNFGENWVFPTWIPPNLHHLRVGKWVGTGDEIVVVAVMASKNGKRITCIYNIL